MNDTSFTYTFNDNNVYAMIDRLIIARPNDFCIPYLHTTLNQLEATNAIIPYAMQLNVYSKV